MIRLALLLALLAGPALADVRVTREQCAQSWLRVIELIYAPLPDVFLTDEGAEKQRALEAVKVTLSPDGWCSILPRTEPALQDINVQEMNWRADGLDAFIADDGLPRRIALRLSGVQLGVSVSDISRVQVVLQHVPDQGLIRVEQLSLGTDDETHIGVTAVVGGAYFRDIGTAMMSLGGLNLERMAVNAHVTPALIADLMPELDADFLKDHVALLSFSQLDRADRRELFDFGDDLPDATGTLMLDYVSERGLGLAQLGFAQSKDGAEAVSFALSGATVHVDWDPK